MAIISKGDLAAGFRVACLQPGAWVKVAHALEVRAQRVYAQPGQAARFQWHWLYSVRIAGVATELCRGRADAVAFAFRLLQVAWREPAAVAASALAAK